MKTTKKVFAVILALAMTMMLTSIAFATEVTLEIGELPEAIEEHTFDAYQIFTGEKSGATAPFTLANIEWGEGVDDEGLLSDLQADDSGLFSYVDEDDEDNNIDNVFDEAESAQDVAEALSLLGVATDNAAAKLFAKYVYANKTATKAAENLGTGDTADVESGYYLLVDVTEVDGEDDAANSLLLRVVNGNTVVEKKALPTVDKLVQDEVADAEEDADENGWGETADHDINETFQYKLVIDIPDDDDFDDYDTYKVILTDTMDKGITFEEIVSVKIINGNDVATLTEDEYECTAEENEVNESWTLTIEDLKAFNYDVEEPEEGEEGEEESTETPDPVPVDIKGAKVEVIYKAHLNEDAVIGEPDVEDDVGNKNTVYLEYSNNPFISTEMGKTVEDSVWVFTYQMPTLKYYLDEDDEEQPLENAIFVLSKTVGEDTLYASHDADNKITGWKTLEDLELDDVEDLLGDDDNDFSAYQFVSGEDGHFDILGLDVGTYELTEIKAPTGYNKLKDPVEVIIDTKELHEEAEDEASASATSILNDEDTIIKIENKTGIQLPETGGIGTTIFYIVGSLLVVGAVIMLVAKKKVNNYSAE